MKSTFLAVSVLCAAGAAALVAQQNPMRPGRWEVTMEMQMANMPMKMPATKTSSCITAEQLAKDPNSGLPSGGPGNAQACKVTEQNWMGNTGTWKVTCTGANPTTSEGTMTFMGESYTGNVKMTTQQGVMTMQLAGKRLGDCTQ